MEFNSNWLKFRQFLQDDISLSQAEIDMVIQRRTQASDPIPMLLWQYGFISIHQLQQIFDWLGNQTQFHLS
jgi:hypothetical protein